MLAALVLGLAGLAAREAPFHDLAYDAALAKAREEGKVVLVDFFTTWCGPCKKLDATTWKDEAVRAWLAEHTVALKIDAEREVALARRFEVRAYPTLVFVRPGGATDRIVGYRDPAAFLREARRILEGKGPVERARADFAGQDTEPSARMALARRLADAGRPAEALEHLLWCWDHALEHRPAWVGVRASFLLADLRRLADAHPPALDAMRARREAAARLLLAPPSAGAEDEDEDGDEARDAIRRAASDVAALDERFFGEPERTLELHGRLKQAGDGAALARRELAQEIEPQLVEARQYADVLAGRSDPVRSFRTLREALERAQERRAPRPFTAGAETRVFVRRALPVYEALLGVGRADEARQLGDLVLEADAHGRTYAQLLERALRAEDAAAAEALLERGRRELTGAHLRVLERAAEPLRDTPDRDG